MGAPKFWKEPFVCPQTQEFIGTRAEYLADPKPPTFYTEYMGVPCEGAKVGEVIGYDRGGMERYARIIRFEDDGAIVKDLGHKGRERYLGSWRVLDKSG